MMLTKELEKDLESLRNSFGLTEEEIEGFLEFFTEKKVKNSRILNSGSKNNDKS
jgi:hypothetical protein